MINLKIDDRGFEAEEGQTVLEVALANGIEIPNLCYHKDLTPYGACRVCLVEIVAGGRPGLEASCMYRVAEGLEVKTDTERVRKARKIVLELLLGRAPEAEKLVKLAARYGITKSRFPHDEADDCILCGLCDRACSEVSKRHAISFTGRGPRRTIQTPFGHVSDSCIGCSACAYVCPTRTITIKEAV